MTAKDLGLRFLNTILDGRVHNNHAGNTVNQFRLVATIEGEEDEVSLIGEAQLILRHDAILKLNSSFGVTRKASDFAPEIGIVFLF